MADGSLAGGRAGVFYFGEFRFEPASGRLWRAGREVSLRPKTSAVLAVLAGRPGEVVGKDELRDAVWPDGFVSEAVLSVCVSELRRALGDEARESRYIATAHRRGYRLVADVTSSPPPAVVPGRLFVGRGSALATLDGWWRAAQGGRRSVGFVTAPAGVGKTAVIDAFAAGLPGRPLIGRGQCVEQFGEGEPYLPMLDALGGLCRGPGGGVVTEVLRRFAPRWLVQLPGLLDDEQLSALQARVAGTSAQRMLREFGDAVAELSRQRPLLLVLEDLHDGDHATAELISYVARRQEPARLLLVGSYRPAEVIARGHPLHRVVQDLGARGLCGQLALELLSAAEVTSYLRARLAPRTPSAGLISDVHKRTEGNALFVVTVTGDLLARGLLAERDGTVEAQGELAALGMPDEVRLMVERQVDRLGELDREMLVAASAAGNEFAAETAAAGYGGGLPAAEVEKRCDRLGQERALLRPAGAAAWPDGTISGKYRFEHEMYRDVLYERLTPARRVQVHRRIAERLAAGYGPRSDEIAAVLAGHFERGQDYPAAVAHLCAAAATALGRSAYPEALRHAGRVLSLLDRLPDRGQRASQELRARRVLVAAAAATWGWREQQTRENCVRLRELATALDDAQALATALFGLHNHAMARSDLAVMRSCAAELDVLARPGAGSDVTLIDHFLHMPHNSLAGLCAPVWEHAQRMLELYRPAEHGQLALLLGDELDVAAHLYASTALWQLGFPDQARQHAAQALRAAREYEIPAGLARTLWFTATTYLMCGDVGRVRDIVAELGAVCAQHDLLLWQAGATVLDGWVLARSGDLAAGLGRLRQGMAAWGRLVPAANGFHSCLAAELCLAAGDTAAGLAEVRSALDAVARTGQARPETELLRLRGELLLREDPGHASAAERSMRRAARIAGRRQARSFQLRAATSLARLWHAQGRTQQARVLLGALLGSFREGHDTTDLIAARNLLGQLGPARP